MVAAYQTITLFVPSVVVTQGEPRPFWLMLQANVIVGGFVGVILYAFIAPASSWNPKYVPWLVW